MPTLTAGAARRQIRSGAVGTLYVLLGDDDLEKEALAAEFAELVEEELRPFNVERIHAGEMTSRDRIADGVDALMASARTLPMMAPRRIVIVLHAEALLMPKRETEAAARAVEALEGFFGKPEPTATVVLVASGLDRRSRLYKLLLREGTVVECGTLEDQADAERWVSARVAANGAVIEPAAARLLAARAGADLPRLRGEVERLLLYALGQKTVTLDDARQVAGPAALQDQWALTNAVETGAAAEALAQVALLFEAGAAPEQILGQLGWVVRAKFPEAAPRQVASAVEALFRTDLALKRANRLGEQPRILLEGLVVELCARRRERPAPSGRR